MIFFLNALLLLRYYSLFYVEHKANCLNCKWCFILISIDSVSSSLYDNSQVLINIGMQSPQGRGRKNQYAMATEEKKKKKGFATCKPIKGWEKKNEFYFFFEAICVAIQK